MILRRVSRSRCGRRPSLVLIMLLLLLATVSTSLVYPSGRVRIVRAHRHQRLLPTTTLLRIPRLRRRGEALFVGNPLSDVFDDPSTRKKTSSLLSTSAAPPSFKSVVSASEILTDDPSSVILPKYTMLGLLWIIACISALDRVAMSIAVMPMSVEFDFTDSVKGAISSLGSVGYGLAILPAGLLVANVSPRIVMALGLATWGVACISTAAFAGDNMTALLFARSLVGVGESAIMPTIQRLLSTWTTPKEKSTALAAIYSGFSAGTIFAYIASPLLMDSLGGDWRGLFYCYGAVGLVVLVPWLAFSQDRPAQQQPPQGGVLPMPIPPPLSPASSAKKGLDVLYKSWEGALETFRDAPWKGFVQSKGTWALVLAHCAKNWGLYIALAWTPTFYAEQYGIGVQESALLSVLPSITGAVCGLVAGAAADSILQNLDEASDEIRCKVRCKVRKAFQSFAFLGQGLALGALAMHIPDDPLVAQSFLMASFALMAFNTAGFEAGIQEKAGEKWAGLMYSVTTLPAVMVGTFGVYITGHILDLTSQDWSLVFGLNAAVNVLGAAAFLALYDSKQEFD